MSEFFKNKLFLLVLRVVIGGVFIYAGALKIGNPLEFADSIATFQVLPSQWVNLVALALPVFEILVGGMLVCGLYQRQAAFSLLVLTVLFALFLIQAIIRGLEVDCGCFGSGEPSAWSAWMSLGRDLLLMVGCAWLWIRSRKNPLSFEPKNTRKREDAFK